MRERQHDTKTMGPYSLSLPHQALSGCPSEPPLTPVPTMVHTRGRSWSRTSTTVLWVPLGLEPLSLGSSRLATPSEVRRVSAKGVSPMGHVLNQRHLD